MEEKLHYKMTIKLWKDDKVFGPGICQLLTKIEEGLGFALTERVSGGRSGGGSRVTEEGRKMMEQYLAFETEAREQVGILFEKYFGDWNV